MSINIPYEKARTIFLHFHSPLAMEVPAWFMDVSALFESNWIVSLWSQTILDLFDYLNN